MNAYTVYFNLVVQPTDNFYVSIAGISALISGLVNYTFAIIHQRILNKYFFSVFGPFVITLRQKFRLYIDFANFSWIANATVVQNSNGSIIDWFSYMNWCSRVRRHCVYF